MKRLYSKRFIITFTLALTVILFTKCSNNSGLGEEVSLEDSTVNVPVNNTVIASGINFYEGSWEEALEEAKKQKKPIFLDAYADWCRPCKEMDRDVFSQQKVGDYYNQNFINVKVNIDKGEGKELSDKYDIMEIPTYLYFDTNGELIKRTIGKKPVDMFINDAKSAIEG